MQLKRNTTSADYGRIQQLGVDMAEIARGRRESAMLDLPAMDVAWRYVDNQCAVQGYDIFKAWTDVSLKAHQLRCQLHWLSARVLNTAGDAYAEVAVRDAAELREKNVAYGESWRRRGGIGAFMMLARKWDRLDNILAHGGGGHNLDRALRKNPGNVLDDIGDLRRYLLLVEDHALSVGANQLPVNPTTRTRLRFSYVNHRNEEHVYEVEPTHVAFGECMCDPNNPAWQAWYLRARVVWRSGERRDVMRSFAFYKIAGFIEVLAAPEEGEEAGAGYVKQD